MARGGCRSRGWFRRRRRAGHDLHFLAAFPEKIAKPFFFIGGLARAGAKIEGRENQEREHWKQ